MTNSSTRLDPTLRSVESQEFENTLRSKVVGQEEAVRALVDLSHDRHAIEHNKDALVVDALNFSRKVVNHPPSNA
jgi:aminopeptidase C